MLINVKFKGEGEEAAEDMNIMFLTKNKRECR